MNIVRLRIDSIATEIGRLHRQAKPETSLFFCIERLADHVESLDCMLAPSAGQLCERYGVERALAIVDARTDALRSLLAR
jgi:hypothetical protein